MAGLPADTKYSWLLLLIACQLGQQSQRERKLRQLSESKDQGLGDSSINVNADQENGEDKRLQGSVSATMTVWQEQTLWALARACISDTAADAAANTANTADVDLNGDADGELLCRLWVDRARLKRECSVSLAVGETEGEAEAEAEVDPVLMARAGAEALGEYQEHTCAESNTQQCGCVCAILALVNDDDSHEDRESTAVLLLEESAEVLLAQGLYCGYARQLLHRLCVVLSLSNSIPLLPPAPNGALKHYPSVESSEAAAAKAQERWSLFLMREHGLATATMLERKPTDMRTAATATEGHTSSTEASSTSADADTDVSARALGEAEADADADADGDDGCSDGYTGFSPIKADESVSFHSHTRTIQVAAAALGGGIALSLAGAALVPSLAPMVSVAFEGLGLAEAVTTVTAATTTVAVAEGVSTIAVAEGVLGAGLGLAGAGVCGSKMASRTRGCEEFSFKRLRQQTGETEVQVGRAGEGGEAEGPRSSEPGHPHRRTPIPSGS